jgi:hypothetical protein
MSFHIYFKSAITISIILCLVNLANAQEITIKVIEDTVYSSNQKAHKSSPLQWSNFKAVITEDEQAYSALTSTRLSYQVSQRGTAQKQTITVKPKFYFDELGSKKKLSAQNDYILNHEQRHFDIGYYWYKKFIVALRNLQPDRNAVQTISNLYKEYGQSTKQMQSLYDEETDHSRIKEKQELWDAKIKELLLEVE